MPLCFSCPTTLQFLARGKLNLCDISEPPMLSLWPPLKIGLFANCKIPNLKTKGATVKFQYESYEFAGTMTTKLSLETSKDKKSLFTSFSNDIIPDRRTV